jgi:hypothetical protein
MVIFCLMICFNFFYYYFNFFNFLLFAVRRIKTLNTKVFSHPKSFFEYLEIHNFHVILSEFI